MGGFRETGKMSLQHELSAFSSFPASFTNIFYNIAYLVLSDMTSPISSRLLYKIFIKLVCILPLFCQHINLVIGGEVDDDSLENALEAIERRQRDLQIRGWFFA